MLTEAPLISKSTAIHQYMRDIVQMFIIKLQHQATALTPQIAYANRERIRILTAQSALRPEERRKNAENRLVITREEQLGFQLAKANDTRVAATRTQKKILAFKDAFIRLEENLFVEQTTSKELKIHRRSIRNFGLSLLRHPLAMHTATHSVRLQKFQLEILLLINDFGFRSRHCSLFENGHIVEGIANTRTCEEMIYRLNNLIQQLNENSSKSLCSYMLSLCGMEPKDPFIKELERLHKFATLSSQTDPLSTKGGLPSGPAIPKGDGYCPPGILHQSSAGLSQNSSDPISIPKQESILANTPSLAIF